MTGGPADPPRAPGRRLLLLVAGAALLGAIPETARAQDPAAAAPAPDTPSPAPAAPPRRPRRRRQARRAEPPAPEAQAAVPPRPDLAPVPNRNLEGPRAAAPSQSPSFGPSIIHRPLPSTSSARDGSRSYDEERLFFPAPGARLTVPFSY